MTQGTTSYLGGPSDGFREGEGLKAYAVVVCFNPDVENIHRMCESLLACGSKVVLVDNTHVSYLTGCVERVGCELITLGENKGIAYAQNVGIQRAHEGGADVIVFFDQDSRFARDFVPTLIAPLKGPSPQIVSPLLIDDASGLELPAQRLNGLGMPRPVYGAAETNPFPVDVVIASGTAATSGVFDVAGLMDEDLFIDHVDTEWCLRCRGNGVPIHVVPTAVMRHTIGKPLAVLPIATISLHDPTRCYYQIRNSLLLFRRSHVPFFFALRETLSILWNRLALLSLVENKSTYLRAFIEGGFDGLRGVVGKRQG